MKNYLYKVLIAGIAFIVVFKFTIGKEIAQINEKIIPFLLLTAENKSLVLLKKKFERLMKKKTT